MQFLKELIIEKIDKKGKITFAEFMQAVLYHPQYGYYNSDRERIGKSGDYYTGPTVHGMFGKLIAKQLEEMWRVMGKGAFTVVEIGANRGWLCYDIIHSIKKEYPGFYANFHYIIVETNPHAKEKQMTLLNSVISAKLNRASIRQETAEKRNWFDCPITQHSLAPFSREKKETYLSPFLSGEKDLDGKVSWHSCSKDGFTFGRMQGCFVSNEFFDALPVHRLKMKNKILKEVYVGYNTAGFYETDDEISRPSITDYIETNRIYLKEGQEYEVNLGAAKWLRHASEKLNKGFILTVDYGDTAEAICRGNHTGGTVRCYYKHTVNRDYYKRLGEQDITTHVDFTNLMNAGRLLGFDVTGFTKQSHFLIALGVLERLRDTNTDIETRLKMKNLLHPEGMGDIFKVLIQHKNIKNSQLSGLRPLQSITI